MNLKIAVNSKDHIQGNAAAQIELVEYGDYQCPHCGHAYPIIKAIQEKLGDNVKFIFRNFPLQEMHPNAVNAAVATEAASMQGKFWEMHDIIFENQHHLGDNHIKAYAEKIGLDVPKFENDFTEEALLQKVEEDFESGIRSGVNGTPCFFINGIKYQGSWEEDELLDVLDNMLAK